MDPKMRKIVSKALNANYHIGALSLYLMKSCRSQLSPMSKKVQNETGENIISVKAKMMMSAFVTGCTFEEYYYLHFYRRTLKNQNTYFTTFYNSSIQSKYNDYDQKDVFLDKAKFNQKYQQFRKIPWISMDSDIGEIADFLHLVDEVILKPRKGDSGKGIFVAKSSEILANADFESWVAMHRDYICEKRIYNSPEMNLLNSTSLNTLRVITFLTGMTCNIIWTGVRIGKPGEIVDNISVGGVCCPIDLTSGKIIGNPLAMKSTVELDYRLVGTQIPDWKEVLKFIKDIALVTPSMRFMAWDIAISSEGLVVIEGNHSFGNTVCQIHQGTDDDGLRAVMKKYL